MPGTLTKPFDPLTAGKREQLAWHELTRNLRQEVLPDEPVPSLEHRLKLLKAGKTLRRRLYRAIWDTNRRMTGYCFLSSPLENEAARPKFIDIGITPEWRRKGLATALFNSIRSEAVRHGWEELLIQTNDHCPAGESLARSLGAEQVSSAWWNRLDLNRIDRSLMDSWVKGGRNIRLELWKGSVPDDRLSEYIELHQLIHDEKRDEPGFSEYTFTAENVRSREAAAAAEGRVKVILAALDEPNGRLAGLTVVNWAKALPQVVSQGYTAVLPHARGKGIAKRLKAEMIAKLAAMNPEAVFLKTGNAAGNAPILHLNELMGFRRALTTTDWKIRI